MIKINGFFGSIHGPFQANQQIIDLIQKQCNSTIVYLSKVGFHYEGNYNLDISGAATQQITILINENEFILGATRMLELENVQITSLKFKQNVNEHFFIDYIYQGKM